MIKTRTNMPSALNHPAIAAAVKLMRLDKPIGIYLVLWPTLWALWIASEGIPDWSNLVIFVLGAFVMRSAGCVINDYADRAIDGHVQRTQHRPLPNGDVPEHFALILFAVLITCALGLVLLTNLTTMLTALGALVLTAIYPYMKRHTYLPQVVLGAAFAWAIPMAFAAVTETLPKPMWTLFLSVVVWTVVYDTFYAMVDREDDLKIGVRSTAILFAENDRIITGSLQVFTVMMLFTIGSSFKLHWPFYLSLIAVAALFGYQQYLIRERDQDKCFEAFINNNWVGMAVFIGIVLSYAVAPEVAPVS